MTARHEQPSPPPVPFFAAEALHRPPQHKDVLLAATLGKHASAELALLFAELHASWSNINIA